MVTACTQYRKHFKKPVWDDFAVDEYHRKRDYRLGRRSIEHQHEPWHWDSSDSDDEDSDVDPIRATSRQVLSKKKITDISPDGRPKNHRSDKKKEAVGKFMNNDKKSVVEATDKLPSGVVEAHTKRKHSEITHAGHRKSSSRRKSGKHDRDSEVHDETHGGSFKERAPFVSYGWANDAAIEQKLTHNVRAHPKDVYPASLRALKRRQLDIRQKMEANRRKAMREQELLKEKFCDYAYISPVFLTEYQSSYCNMGESKTGYVW